MRRSPKTRSWWCAASRRSNPRSRSARRCCSTGASKTSDASACRPSYARSDDEVLDLAEDRLVVFASLFVFRLDDVIDAGFEVIPTYRSPHVTIAFYDEPDVAVPRLLAVRHRVIANHAFGKEEP